MTRLKLLFACYLATILALFLYSFTQVDLSLTLSRISIYQQVEKLLQNIGFFQRPLSALIFSLIFLLLFIFYLTFLFLSKKNKIHLKHLKIVIFATFIILVFSYNAFSYDLFNYIFDAKIVTFYHQNPYLFKATDFANDPMLSFMRWTHRTFPYGPVWLMLTVPLSFLGMGYFLPTFFIFKILMGVSFLGSCYLVYKISEKLFPENKLTNLVFFAFNPLVITETLVSAHNDIPMIFLFLLSIYLFLQNKKVLAWTSNILSIGVKFSTGVLFPIFIILEFYDKTKRKISWEKFFIASVFLSLATIVFASIRTTFQPWYLVFPLSLCAFVSKKNYILIPFLLLSFFGVLIYFPYVLMTDYDPSYPMLIKNIETVGVLVFIISAFSFFIKDTLLNKH